MLATSTSGTTPAPPGWEAFSHTSHVSTEAHTSMRTSSLQTIAEAFRELLVVTGQMEAALRLAHATPLEIMLRMQRLLTPAKSN